MEAYVQYNQKAVDLTQFDDPYLLRHLFTLVTAQRLKYILAGQSNDVQTLIIIYREAVELIQRQR